MIIENYSDYLNNQSNTTKPLDDTHNSTVTDLDNLIHNESEHKISPSSMSTITENLNYNPDQSKLSHSDKQIKATSQNQQQAEEKITSVGVGFLR